MELIGICNQDEHKITVEETDDHRYVVTVDERRFEVDCLETMANVFTLIHGSQSHEVRIDPPDKRGKTVTHFFSDSFEVTVADPLERLLEEALGGGAAGAVPLEAAMPGKVQRVLVKVGDEVEEEQGLLVLVAMKMENELGSPKKGLVKEINVAEGDNVEAGATLIVVE